jgi:hypothetical protein
LARPEWLEDLEHPRAYALAMLFKHDKHVGVGFFLPALVIFGSKHSKPPLQIFQAAMGSVHPGATKFPSQPLDICGPLERRVPLVRPLLFGENGASGCINPGGF